MTIDELKLLITANTSQFRGEIQGVKKELQQLNQNTKNMAQGMGKSFTLAGIKANIFSNIIMNAFNSIKNTIANVIKSIITNGSQFSRLKIAAQTVAQNMGVTQQQTDALVSSLENANVYGSRAYEVIKTLSQSGLVQLSAGLKATDARTGEMTQGVEALVLTMKDLSAAALVDSAEGIDRITKFVRTGNQQYVDGILEIGRINTAYQQFADQTGRTITQLSAQEQAQVRLNLVMLEGEKTWGAYANTMQTSGKAFASIRDASFSITERLGNFLEPAIATFANGVFQLVNSVRQAVLGSEATVKGFAIRLAAQFVVMFRILGRLLSMLPGVGKYFKDLANFSVKPIKALGSMTDQVGGLSDNLDKSADSTKKLKKELAGLAAFDELNVLKNPAGASDTGGFAGGGLGGADFADWGDALEDNSAVINGYADQIMKKLGTVGEFLTGWKDKVVRAFNTVSSIVTPIWTRFTGLLTETWNNHGPAIVAGVQEMIGNLQRIFQSLYTNVLEPIIKPFLKVFKELWNGVLKDVQRSAFDFLGTLIEVGLLVYNKAIAPLGLAILSTLRPVATFIGGTMSQSFKNFVTIVGGAIKSSLDTMTGLLNFVKGLFNTNWRGAWENVKRTLESVFSSFGNIVKSSINYVIRKINDFFRSINKVKVPSWVPEVGGRGFSFGQIPYLAQGGVLDSPTLAVLGESGKEAVMPLENNTGWISDLANKIKELGGGGDGFQLVLKLGEDKIYDKFVDWHNNKVRRTNSKLLYI